MTAEVTPDAFLTVRFFHSSIINHGGAAVQIPITRLIRRVEGKDGPAFTSEWAEVLRHVAHEVIAELLDAYDIRKDDMQMHFHGIWIKQWKMSSPTLTCRYDL